MNHAYRLVWNEVHRRTIPAPETAKGRGKRTGRCLRRSALVMALGTTLLSLGAQAGPTGGTVSVGSGSIRQSGTGTTTTTTVTQNSQNLAINWASFGTAAGESVHFVQPNRSAIALNRVTGSRSSVLNGSLSANGQVWILNPNGVLFGSTASVNVGGLVASTLSLSDADFLAGKRSFSGDGSQGSVVNQGSLTGGYVALLGKRVSNSGTITATTGGTAALAAGDRITLDFSGNHLLSVQVDEGTLNALAGNKGLIRAGSGTVILTASAKDALLDTVVNNEGVIEARGIYSAGGTILLLGGMNGGTVKVGGTLDASANGSHAGGFIETSGAHVQVADGARISTLSDTGKTGTWLIDPTDFTISAGSGSQTGSGIGAATLASNLGSNNVTLATDNSTGTDSGDINVNAAVSWSANTMLTLSAFHNVNVNAAITATGASAGLALNYGGDYKIAAPITLSGAGASLSLNSTAYTLIHNMAALDAIDNTGLSGHYALAQDLDASGTTYTSALVGDSSNTFTGLFAGLGHTIGNLTINTPSTDKVGLFSQNRGTIRDLGLVGGSVSGNIIVGALVGYSTGLIRNAYATGSVSGSGYYVGGLVGYSSGTISNAYATGSVSGISDAVGGLAGGNGGSMTNAYATGNVSGGSNQVGGLVGSNNIGGSIINAYATGSVSGTGNNVGGLVGQNSGNISNAYATGNVSGSSHVGGLAGRNSGSISNAYWDSASTGQIFATGQSTGPTSHVGPVISSNATNHGSYANLGSWAETVSGSGVWVATDNSSSGNKLWVMVEGSTRPFLYSEYSTSIRNAHQLQLMAYDLGASYTLGANIDASETSGSNLSGMWTTSGFSPMGNNTVQFSGSLDGQNHTITDLNISRAGSDYAGLFGWTSSTSAISNLGLVGGSVSGHDGVGTLAGENDGSISNAYATGTVSGGNNYAGGLVGKNDGSISNAYATGDAGAPSFGGGLVGYNTGTISNAYATGNVGGNGFQGGLVGQNDGSISNAHATGNAIATVNYAGGLVGQNNGSIDRAYATGNASGGGFGYYDGGLVGDNHGSINNAYATGSVSGVSFVGGLVGVNNSGSTISNAYASGNVSGTGINIGGLVGENDGTIGNAYATGRVSGSTGYVGGLVGVNDSGGTISNAYATGTVSGTGNNFGGLVGTNDGSISNAYASGSVSGSEDNVGGLVGTNVGSISTAHATGFVSGYAYLGGLVGVNGGRGTISNAYDTGNVSGSNLVGGLVGTNLGSISTAYATGNVSGTGNNFGGLVGTNDGSISNAYATGSVSGRGSAVGGLVGTNLGSIGNAYATGSVSGGSNVGALVGYDNGGTVASFWLSSVSATGFGFQNGTVDSFTRGLSASEATNASSYTAAGWDVATVGGSSSVWRSYAGSTMPLLRSFLTALTVTTGNTGKTYDGTTSLSDSYTLSDSSANTSLILGTASYSTGSQNVGSYAVNTSGLYSGQQGYDIRYVNGTANITATPPVTGPANISATPPVTGPANITVTLPVTGPANISATPPVTGTDNISAATPVTGTDNTRLTQLQQSLQAPQPGTTLDAASASRGLNVQSCGIRLPDGLVCH